MIIYIILGAIILAIPITLIINKVEKAKREKKIETLPHIDIDFSTLKEEDFNKLELQEIKKVYIQLIDLENKIDKTNNHLDDIKFCVQMITFIIVVPIIIGIILKICGINILSGILY